MDTDRFSNVAEPLLASVRRVLDRTAVVFKDQELTYAQLNDEVNRTADVFAARLGAAAGDRVAYLLPNCIEILEVYYAALKLGAAVV